MRLTLDTVALHSASPSTAGEFYAAVFAARAGSDPRGASLDLGGAGRFEFTADPAAGSGFRGFVLSCVVDRPADVSTVVGLAVLHGGRAVKPARKALFGSFSGVLQAPDGALWKVAAVNSKNGGTGAPNPGPTETTLILGVREPKASRRFYEALGMTTDRDYGNKYLDFHPVDGASRLCLMQRPVLAKDVGAEPGAPGPSGLGLVHHAGDEATVRALAAAAEDAGGTVTVAPENRPQGYEARFTDPDGNAWRVLGPSGAPT